MASLGRGRINNPPAPPSLYWYIYGIYRYIMEVILEGFYMYIEETSPSFLFWG